MAAASGRCSVSVSHVQQKKKYYKVNHQTLFEGCEVNPLIPMVIEVMEIYTRRQMRTRIGTRKW